MTALFLHPCKGGFSSINNIKGEIILKENHTSVSVWGTIIEGVSVPLNYEISCHLRASLHSEKEAQPKLNPSPWKNPR